MQLLTLAGSVHKDAELRTTNNGDKVLSFTLMISNGKDESGNWRPSTYYDCSLWGKRAESLAPHIKKGDKLAVSGTPGAREHQGKVYLQCRVQDLTFMGGGKRDDSQQDSGYGAGGRPSRDLDDDFDSIPF